MSSHSASSEIQPFVAVKPYAKFNDDLGLLSIATGPAFTRRSRDGHYDIYPAHMNHMKFAVRDAAAKMSQRTCGGVPANEAQSLKVLTDSLRDTYNYDEDRPDSPNELLGGFQLSLYLTTEMQPRQVPQGDHGLYEPTVAVSEAEMSNLPRAEVYVRSHHDGQSHYFDRIEITIDGTVRDKATRKIVALQPSVIQEMASGFVHMVPYIQDRLREVTHLNNRDRDTFRQALIKTRKDVKSLAISTVDRLVLFDIGPDDVESVRPPGSALVDKSDFETTPDMDGLGSIPVRFTADYSRMGGDGSSSSTVRGGSRGRP